MNACMLRQEAGKACLMSFGDSMVLPVEVLQVLCTHCQGKGFDPGVYGRFDLAGLCAATLQISSVFVRLLSLPLCFP